MKKNLPRADEKKPESASLHSPNEVLSGMPEGDVASFQSEQIEDPLIEKAQPSVDKIPPETDKGEKDSPGSETLGILDEVLLRQKKNEEQALSSRDVQRRRIREHKRRRRIHSVRNFGIILFIIACLLAMIYYLPHFHVQNFQVEGTYHLSDKALIELSGIKEGEHILSGWGGGIAQFFGLRNGGAEDRIRASSPYVQEVRVGAKFPGTVYIEVTERVPISYIDYQGEIVMLDKEGIVLELSRTGPHDIPLIYNVKLDNPVPGEMVSEEVKKTLRPAIFLLNALINADKSANDDFNLLSQVRSITLTEGPETYITLSQAYADPNTRIKLGNRQTLDEAVNWLRYAARTDNLLDLGDGTLDITGTRKIFYPRQWEDVVPETLPTIN